MAIVFPFMSRRAAKDKWVAQKSRYLCRSPAPSSAAKPTPLQTILGRSHLQNRHSAK
jgi:hypothetical protein